METLTLTPDTIIKGRSFDVHVGRRVDQIALVSKRTGDFVPFESVLKSKRLAKAKRMFRAHLSSSTHFFFEFMMAEDTAKLVQLIKS